MLVAFSLACTKAATPVAATWEARLEAFDANDLVTDESAKLASLRGAEGPTVYSFWATYCPPCLEELPMFEKLSKAGHRIVGVSMDAGDVDGAKQALAKHTVTYPQVVLGDESMKAAGLALDAGLPFMLVVGPDGRVRSQHSGKMTEAQVLAAIESAR